MRIGMAVEALARIGDVSLLVVTQRALAITEGVPEKYRKLCEERVVLLKDSDARPHGRAFELLRQTPKLLASWNHDWSAAPELDLIEQHYDIVWVFRLRMWPILQELERGARVRATVRILDLPPVSNCCETTSSL
ncbi:MAG: hypothetical protein V4508_22865 [Pseudomonadota bacterium]